MRLLPLRARSAHRLSRLTLFAAMALSAACGNDDGGGNVADDGTGATDSAADTAGDAASDVGSDVATPDIDAASDADKDGATDADDDTVGSADTADAGSAPDTVDPTPDAAADASGACTFGTFTFGGSGEDVGSAVVAWPGGGAVAVGWSDGGGVGGVGKGGRDAWVLRIADDGTLQWEVLLGNDLDQSAYDVALNGTSAIVGGSWREHGDARPRGWLHAVDGTGAAVGTHVFAVDAFTEVHGVAVAETTLQPATRVFATGYLENDAGAIRLALARVDPTTLSPAWVQHYGDTDFDAAWELAALPDGGAVLVGDTAPGGSGPHLWLVRVDHAGTVAWQRTYHSDGEDGGWAVVAHPDGKGQITGLTVAGRRKAPGATVDAAWLMHTDATGKDLWQQTLPAPGGATAHAIERRPDDSLLLGGRLAKAQSASEASLWSATAAGATLWTTSAGAAGAVGNGVGLAPGANLLVGRSASGKLSDLLLVRASPEGKTDCQP